MRPPLDDNLTAIVPAYNEAASLAETGRSLQAQTRPPAEIIVVDDCSTDRTAEIARSLGVTVLQPPQNTGSKAGAQTFALDQVRTEFVMAVDADTTLAPDAIEELAGAFEDPEVAAACGFVLPRRVRAQRTAFAPASTATQRSICAIVRSSASPKIFRSTPRTYPVGRPADR